MTGKVKWFNEAKGSRVLGKVKKLSSKSPRVPRAPVQLTLELRAKPKRYFELG